MPVVLEEFGSKLDVRHAQYKLAYDSCLTSAKRGGSCAGVMFWDLAHKVRSQLPACCVLLLCCAALMSCWSARWRSAFTAAVKGCCVHAAALMVCWCVALT